MSSVKWIMIGALAGLLFGFLLLFGYPGIAWKEWNVVGILVVLAYATGLGASLVVLFWSVSAFAESWHLNVTCVKAIVIALIVGSTALFLMMGCATTPYVNPLATPQQEARDEVECRALAEQATPPGGVLRGVAVHDRFRRCLEGRGYRPA